MIFHSKINTKGAYPRLYFLSKTVRTYNSGNDNALFKAGNPYGRYRRNYGGCTGGKSPNPRNYGRTNTYKQNEQK